MGRINNYELRTVAKGGQYWLFVFNTKVSIMQGFTIHVKGAVTFVAYFSHDPQDHSQPNMPIKSRKPTQTRLRSTRQTPQLPIRTLVTKDFTSNLDPNIKITSYRIILYQKEFRDVSQRHFRYTYTIDPAKTPPYGKIQIPPNILLSSQRL